jgi:hypothetical protein
VFQGYPVFLFLSRSSVAKIKEKEQSIVISPFVEERVTEMAPPTGL